MAMKMAPNKNREFFNHLVDLNRVFEASCLLVVADMSFASCDFNTALLVRSHHCNLN